VLSVADKDEYAANNGWIEARVGRHNNQRCRWRGQKAGITAGDYVDVLYFASYKLFVVFTVGGAGAIDVVNFPFDVITLDANDPAADYAVFADANSAASAGDTIVVGPGTYAGGGTLTDGVNLIVIDPDATLFDTNSAQYAFTVGANSYVRGLRGRTTASHVTRVAGINMAGDGSILTDCVGLGYNAHASGWGVGIYRSANGSEELRQCYGDGTASNGDSWGYFRENSTTGDSRIVGGKYDGSNQDIYHGGAGVVTLVGPTAGTTGVAGGSGTLVGRYIDASDNLVMLYGSDIRPNGTTLGVARRSVEKGYAGTIDSHFRTGDTVGNGELSAYALASSPFVSGSISYSFAGEFLLVTPGSGNRVFMYKSVSINDRLECVMAGSSVENAGMRVDDGSDNNYYEFRLEDLANGTCRINAKHRTGGGSVTTVNGQPIPFHTMKRVSLNINDLGAGNHRYQIRLWPGESANAGSLLHLGSSVSWTPSRGGPVAEHIGSGVWEWIGSATGAL
jgi:hypothetical protein